MRRRIDRPQAIESSDAAVAATAAIIRQARRSLHVYSRELDPGLLDAPRVLEALRELCTRGDGLQVQVLLQDTAATARQSDGWGTRVSVRVKLGGLRLTT